MCTCGRSRYFSSGMGVHTWLLHAIALVHWVTLLSIPLLHRISLLSIALLRILLRILFSAW